MRILFVTQIYLPEMGALSNRLYPLARRLAASGHEVFVATGMPNYPKGEVFENYRGRRRMREELNGVTVLRTACYVTPRNQSKWAQLRSYLSFIPAALRSGWRAGKLDVVFVTSPPLFALIPALLLAKLRGARLVFDIRDLWPDELVTYAGYREDSLPVRALGALARLGYRTADCIVGTTDAIIDAVVTRGAPREKTFLMPNGADLELFSPQPRDNPIARQYPFGQRFVVMYSGLFGIKHSLEVLLEAAALLREHKEIVFFLLGNGARRAALVAQAAELKLDNVIFGDERPVEDISALISRADVCFAAVRPEPYPKKVISVKVFEYLACERPVVGALSGESARVLAESGGGIVVAPGDARAVADAVLELYRDPARRASMGAAGRRYVEEHYSRAAWAARLEQRINEVCGRVDAAAPLSCDTGASRGAEV
ncbi:MAG TPA: glycosyltransferase family 4 protein [Pyrinomonadaceae bacterium]|nr:glycosyltransferase family 4 protein [Pyrinomonadaceae bacterium]